MSLHLMSLIHLPKAKSTENQQPEYHLKRHPNFELRDLQNAHPAYLHLPLTNDFPATGRILPPLHRCLISLTVHWPSHYIQTPKLPLLFVLNTISSESYLNYEAMSLLIGTNDSIPESLKVEINGLEEVCWLAPEGSGYKHLNVLGMSFLARHHLKLFLNFASLECTLSE